MAVHGASLQQIYNRLNAVEEQTPGSAITFSDWSMQAGDTVTIVRDGKEYKTTVHSSTTVWKGKTPTVTINHNGTEKRVPIATEGKRKFGRGGSGLRASENAYWDMITSYNNMTSGLILASSSAALYVDNKYTQMSSGLKLTSSSAALYVDNKYTQMTSGLKLTSSSAALYVDNKYTQMSSGLKLTSSTAALYVDNKYTQMSSGLKLTSSSAALYVDNKYTQMTSGLKLSSSSAALYVDNKYTQMTAGLKLSSSSAALYVDNKYTQMSSGLALTSSTAALYVDNKYTQMSSGLKLTSSSAALYVDNKYTQMTAGLRLSSSSAALYASSAENAAQIAARINESTGQSEIQLDAQKVYIGTEKSTTVIAGKCELSDVTANYIDSKISTLATLHAKDISANSITAGVNLYLPNGLSVYSQGIWQLNLSQNANNTYTLKETKLNGDERTVGTFSRAVSSWDWTGGNGQVKVTAQPQDQTLGVDVRVNGDATIASNGTYTYKAQYEDDNGSYWDIGGEGTKTITVNVPASVPSDLGIYDAYSVIIPSQTISPGNSINLWAGCNIGQTGEAWGSKVTITAGTYPSRTLRCTKKEQTYPGSTTYTYTFTLEGSYSFSAGSSYTFYRTGWS